MSAINEVQAPAERGAMPELNNGGQKFSRDAQDLFGSIGQPERATGGINSNNQLDFAQFGSIYGGIESDLPNLDAGNQGGLPAVAPAENAYQGGVCAVATGRGAAPDMWNQSAEYSNSGYSANSPEQGVSAGQPDTSYPEYGGRHHHHNAVNQLFRQTGNLDGSLAQAFGSSPDGGQSVLTSATSLESQMMQDPNLRQNARMDAVMLKMDSQLAQEFSSLPNGEQLMNQILQAQQQALGILEGSIGGGVGSGGYGGDNGGFGGGGGGGTVNPGGDNGGGTNPGTNPGGDNGGSTNPGTNPGGDNGGGTNPGVNPGGDNGGSTNPGTNPGGDNGGGSNAGGGNSGGSSGGGADMSSIFSSGDSGVTSAEKQHAIQIADQLPSDIQQALLKGGAQMTLLSGFNGGAQGENNGSQGDFYVDSGMADQAEVHELYEMAGQISGTKLGGSWNDAQAVSLADQAMQGNGPNPGDLNDTVGQYQGDGDLMSNAFVADFFASHPGLNQDTFGQSVLQATDQAAPQLEAYIAQQQGLTNASQA